MRIRGNIPFSKIARIFSTFDPSTLIPGIFASKTDGNDADDGLTEATAKETLDPGIEAIDSANAVVGLYYGDEWNEQYDPDVDGIKLIPYGTPANGLPVISGMDVITGWTLVAAMTYAYEKSIAHSIGNSANYNYLMVAEIDETDEVSSPYTSYVFLQRVDDVATCESTPGSFYAPLGLTGTDTVTIHPSDSSNPNSNGKRYEVTRREYCVSNYSNEDVVLYKLALYLSGHGYGQLAGGINTYVQQVLFLGSGVHSAVVKNGTMDQCVFVSGPSGLSSPAQVVYYTSDATGLNAILKNSVFFSSTMTSFYCHNSGGQSQKYDTITLSNIKGFGDRTRTFGGAEWVDTVLISNCFFDGYSNIFYGAQQNLTIENCIIKNSIKFLSMTSPAASGQVVTIRNCLIDIDTGDPGGINSSYIFELQKAGSTITIENCIINVKSTYTGTQDVAVAICANLRTNTTNFNNNIVITDVPVNKKTRIMIGDSGGVDGQMINGEADNNVYILLGGQYQQDICWLRYDPNFGDVPFGVWKTKTGQDVNSLYYDYITLGLNLTDLFTDHLNGDWTLKSSSIHKSAIEAIGAGMTTPPTSYPSTLTKEQAVTKMIAGDLATETIWD